MILCHWIKWANITCSILSQIPIESTNKQTILCTQTSPWRFEPLTMSSLYFFLSPWWRSLSWLAISLYWSLSCWQVSSSLDRMSRASFLLSSFRLHTRNYNKQRAVVLWDALLLIIGHLAVCVNSRSTGVCKTSIYCNTYSFIFPFPRMEMVKWYQPRPVPTGGKTHTEWSQVLIRHSRRNRVNLDSCQTSS